MSAEKSPDWLIDLLYADEEHEFDSQGPPDEADLDEAESLELEGLRDLLGQVRASHVDVAPPEGLSASILAAAREAGIPIYAGTDAGSTIAHGRIADEVEALKGIGMSPTDALGAACWDARRWLGRQGLEAGAPADLVCYADDPRSGAKALNLPDVVILRGTLVA